MIDSDAMGMRQTDLRTHDIQQLVGEPDYSRGAAYYGDGRVLDVRVQVPDRVTGSVSGLGRKVYDQEILLEWNRAGVLTGITGICSCSVGWNCKHVVAVLLSAKGSLSAQTARPVASECAPAQSVHVPPLPHDVDVWLRGLEAAAMRKPAGKSSPDGLYYVMTAELQLGALVVPVKARILKNGGFSKNSSEYTGRSHQWIPPKFMTLDDVGILQKLDALARCSYPRRYDWPEGDALFAFLREVIGTGRARGFTLQGPVLTWAGPRKGYLDWRVDESANQRLGLVVEDGADVEVLPFAPPIYVDRETGACGPVETGVAPGVAARAASAPEIPHHVVPAVSERLSAGVRGLPLLATAGMRERRRVPVPVLRLSGRIFEGSGLHHAGGLDMTVPVIHPVFDYDGHEVLPGHEGDPVLREGDDTIVLRRDGVHESAALARLADVADHDARPVADFQRMGRLRIGDVGPEDYILPPVAGGDALDGPGAAAQAGLSFTAEMLPALREEGWRIETDDSWPFRLHDGPVDIHAGAESSGTDWFSFALKLEADGEEVDLLGLVLSLIDNLPVGPDGLLDPDIDVDGFLSEQLLYPQLADGRRVALAGETLAPILRAFLEAQGLVTFHPAEAGRAAALAEALEGCGVPWKGGRELLELGEKLRALAAAPEVTPPDALKAELRPYQKAGYGWLKALSDTGFGGVLADDMGLGKTVQALALLVERHLAMGSDRPSLLVVPTSLVGNWEREAARFAPDLKLLILHGPDRKQHFDAIPKHHLVITTYPLVHRDHEALFAHAYDLAILDEAQAVKNPAATISKRIRDIDARQRIALTGTPMENNLAELWALFDWLVPGLLGKRAEFTKTFRTPIEKHGDRSRQKLLSARVQPFLLRRTKEAVAGDLPPKTEIDEIIPLDGTQRGLYEALRVAMDERVREAIRRRGMEGSRITILDALLKLRQACCDPALIRISAPRVSAPRVSDLKLDAAHKVDVLDMNVSDMNVPDMKVSAKRARLMALLEELVAEGRKVLVFSQFVEMLKLIEADVTAKGWDYAMLTGRTKDRAAQVDKFQTTDAPVFLISLKAGGTGLNLTAADTVILYDPWWNPAAERQAMDRAHRIGQDKPVFVHKLIAEGTVEAAIQTMQAKKQALADALFDDAGGGGPMALAEEDIAALFAPVA